MCVYLEYLDREDALRQGMYVVGTRFMGGQVASLLWPSTAFLRHSLNE